MKKLILLLLALTLLLCGCKGEVPAETTEPVTTLLETTEPPTTEPPATEPPTTEAPTTEPPAIVNPFNGITLSQPYTGRAFTVVINNVSPAVPFKGVSQADLFFEMLVNDRATRCLALFSDITSVPAIGSLRSNRLNFNEISYAYDAVLTHAGGSDLVLGNMNELGIDNLRGEVTVSGFRDKTRINSGYAWEHCLFVTGQELYDTSVKRGYEVTQPEDKDYGLSFTDDATPVNGEDATKLQVWFWEKRTLLEYNQSTGKYDYYEFGDYIIDENNGQRICFNNVIVMKTPIQNISVYHVAQTEGSGDGYFACGGKIIPIKWIHENPEDPFTFTLEDGTPLELNVGNTYVAFAPVESDFIYE